MLQSSPSHPTSRSLSLISMALWTTADSSSWCLSYSQVCFQASFAQLTMSTQSVALHPLQPPLQGPEALLSVRTDENSPGRICLAPD